MMALLTACAAPPTPASNIELTATAESKVLPTMTLASSPVKNLSPRIDGIAAPDEWNRAVMTQVNDGAVATSFYAIADSQKMYLRVDAKTAWKTFGDITVGAYFDSPRLKERSTGSHFNSTLNFNSTTLVEVLLIQGGGYFGAVYQVEKDLWNPVETLEAIGVKENVLEFSMPIKNLGNVSAGDEVKFVFVISKDERELQKSEVKVLAVK